MAALRDLKILLLWAGIISLANSTPPPTTLPPQCNYTVTPVKYGFQISITGSTTGNYTINIREEGQPGKTHNSNQVSLYEVKFLKPCTEYEHHVTFVDRAGKETPCTSTEDKTRTTGMNKDDIKEVNCTPGYVCYHSGWDISTSLSTSNNIPAESCKSDQTAFCIKPGFNDICSDLTTTFTCGNSSFTLTKSISVDFLNPSEIIQKPPTKFPAEIETTLPPNCKNLLTLNYTCLEDGKLNKNLSELEPFTRYSCTGQIKENNVYIKNKTTAIEFTIDCDLVISITNKRPTDISIDLSWTSTSQNCPYPHLQKLSYVCSCWSSSHNGQTRSQGQSCSISGLEPYTDYTCEVQPTYNNKNVGQPEEVTQKTAAGKPDDIQKLTVEHPEHNVITVTCDKPIIHFKGPKKIYIARLYDSSVPPKELEKKQEGKCEFTFSDLRYSTSYNLMVTAFNGEHESERPKSEIVETYYNDKAVIGFLVFLIILTSVALSLVIYKIYIYILRRRESVNEVSEDVMLQSTAIYANVPQSEYRRKDAR